MADVAKKKGRYIQLERSCSAGKIIPKQDARWFSISTIGGCSRKWHQISGSLATETFFFWGWQDMNGLIARIIHASIGDSGGSNEEKQGLLLYICFRRSTEC